MFDLVIVGGGIAGLTSALYALRAGLKVLIIEKNQFGGQIINSNNVENYPGFKNISGYDLINNLLDQVKNYNPEIVYEDVIKVTKESVITDRNEYKTKTIIIASGLNRRSLNINEKEFIGKGVSYCATCDGNFFKGKNVAVVGGGNTAIEDALYLSSIVNKVYVIHRRNEFRADKINVDKLKDINNVEFILDTNVVNINGDELVSSIELDSGLVLYISGLFIAIGFIPDNDIYKDILNVDSDGFIISNNTLTNVENIFVAGDVRTSDLKQLVTAASDGAMAATNAIKYLK